MHPARLSPDDLLKQCTQKRVRRSGPGGQRKNKVETGIVLTHLPTGIQAESSRYRHTQDNLRTATTQLRVKLALGIRYEPDDSPSPLWTSRCRQGKIILDPGHEDFASLLSEALDFLFPLNGDTSLAADSLNCSASQLVRLLKYEPKALGLVNEWRAGVNLRSLL